jgi:chemotaxis protein MotB
MAGDSKKLQPIIIKRMKKSAHGVHGGAWKIAYADFVTAMMAFFLLMWLLGSVTDGDKKGIADYFNTPLKVALLSTGSGSGDASHVIKGGGTDFSRAAGQVKSGEVPPDMKKINLAAMKAEHRRKEMERLRGLREKVDDILARNPKLAAMRSQIRLDMIRDGLRIQIVDENGRPMFDTGSALVKTYMRDFLAELGSVLAAVPNRLTLEGHTDATSYGRGEGGYSNWELSSDRANASRRELIHGGLPQERVMRVQGMASINLYEPQNPHGAANRRIAIIVMNKESEDRIAAGDALESDPAAPVTDLPASAAAPATEPAR